MSPRERLEFGICWLTIGAAMGAGVAALAAGFAAIVYVYVMAVLWLVGI